MSIDNEGDSGSSSAVICEIDPQKQYQLNAARKLLHLHKDIRWKFVESLGLRIKTPPWIGAKGRGFVSGSELIRFIDTMCDMSRAEFLRRQKEFDGG